MTLEYAAGRVGLPVAEFINEMKKDGYSIPVGAMASAQ